MDFDSALRDLEKAELVNSQAAQPDAELALKIVKLQAATLLRGGQIEQANRTWERLLEAHPDDELLLEEVIDQQLAEGLLDQALQSMDRLLDITRDPYQLVIRRVRKANILQRSDKPAEALQVYRETMPRVGRDTWLERELIANIVTLFDRADNLTGLEEYLRTMIESEADRVALRNSLAQTLLQLGKQSDAIKTLQEIVELTPGQRNHRESLIQALAASGDLAAATRQLEVLSRQFPHDAELSFQMADYQRQLGHFDVAQEALRQFILKSNNSESAYQRATRFLQSAQRDAETRDMYQEFLSRHPTSTLAREAFGKWLHQNNEQTAAVELWIEGWEQADKQQILQIAQWLRSHREVSQAYQVLQGRLPWFSSDTVYVEQLIDLALTTGRYDETLPLIRRRAALCRSTSDVESTIRQALRIGNQLSQPAILLACFREDAAIGPDTKPEAIPLGAICVLSELYHGSGQIALAHQILDQAQNRLDAVSRTEQHQRALEMLLSQKIRLFSKQHDWGQAANAAEQLANVPGPRQVIHIQRLVNLSIQADKFAHALAWISRWKQLSPGNVQPWIQEAKIMERLNLASESLATLRQAHRRFPQDENVAMLLAEKLVSAQEFDEAERLYWRLYDQEQDTANRLHLMGLLAELKTALGFTESLIENLRQRQNTNPESIEPLLAMAKVYQFAHNNEAQLNVLNEASLKQPNNLTLNIELARLAENAGETAYAIEVLERIRPLDVSGDVNKRLIRLVIESGDVTRSVQLIEEAFERHGVKPRDAELFIINLLAVQEYELATELLVSSLTRWPEDWRLHYLLALTELENGDSDSAQEKFLQLLQLPFEEIPNSPQWLDRSPYEYIGRLYAEYAYSDLPPVVSLVEQLLRVESMIAFPNNIYWSWRSHRSSGSFLPGRREEGLHSVLWHLLALSQERPEEERRQLLIKLASSGIPDAELIFDVLSDPDGRHQNLDHLLVKYEGRLDFWRCLLLVDEGLPDQRWTQAAVTQLREADPLAALVAWIEGVREHEGESEIDWATGCQLVKRLGTIKQPNDLALAALESTHTELASRIGYSQDESEAEQVPELRTLQRAIEEQSIAWASHIDASHYGGLSHLLLRRELAQLLDHDNLQALIDKIEAEVAGQTLLVTSPTYLNFYGKGSYFGGPSSELVVPLSLPLRHSNLMFPEPLSRYLGTLQEIDMSNAEQAEESDESDESDENDLSRPQPWFTALVAQRHLIRNPLLTAFLLIERELEQMPRDHLDFSPSSVSASRPFVYRGGLPDDKSAWDWSEVEQFLANWRQQEPANFDAMILSACLASERRDWSGAIECLEQGRHHPMTVEQRKLLDGAILGIVAKFEELNNDPNRVDSLRSFATDAIGRLQQHTLSKPEQEQLIEVMLHYNMDADALRYRAAHSTQHLNIDLENIAVRYGNIVHAGIWGSGRVRSGSAGVRSDSAEEREKNTELWLRRFRLVVDKQLRQPLHNIDLQLIQALRTEFRDLKINEARFLQRLLEVAGDKPALFGIASEVFDKNTAALQKYRQALDEAPEQPLLRFRACLLEILIDQPKVAEHLQALPSDKRARFSQMLLDWLESRALAPELIFQIVDAVVTQAETEVASGNQAWATTLAKAVQLVAGEHKSRWNLDAADARTVNQLRAVGTDAPLLEFRWQLISRLCELLQKSPIFRAEALQQLLLIAEIQERPLPPWTANAAESILQRSKSHVRSSSYIPLYRQSTLSPVLQYAHLFRDRSSAWRWSDHFAVLHVAENLAEGHGDVEPTSYLAILEQRYGAAAAGRVKMCYDLLLVPEAGFAAASESIALDYIKENRPASQWMAAAETMLIVAGRRGLVTEIGPALVGLCEEKLLNDRLQRDKYLELMGGYCFAVADLSRYDSIRRTFDALVAKLFPSETERDVLLKNYRPPKVPRQGNRGPVAAYVRLLELLRENTTLSKSRPRSQSKSQSKSQTPSVPEISSAEGLIVMLLFEAWLKCPTAIQWDFKSLGPFLSNAMGGCRSLEELANIYDKLPLPRTLSDFRNFEQTLIDPDNGKNSRQTLWFEIFSNLKFRDADLPRTFGNYLLNRSAPTFADRLWAAWLLRESINLDRAAMLEILAPDLETLEKLAEHQRQEIADLVMDLGAMRYQSLRLQELSPQARQVYSILKPHFAKRAVGEQVRIEQPSDPNLPQPSVGLLLDMFESRDAERRSSYPIERRGFNAHQQSLAGYLEVMRDHQLNFPLTELGAWVDEFLGPLANSQPEEFARTFGHLFSSYSYTGWHHEEIAERTLRRAVQSSRFSQVLPATIAVVMLPNSGSYNPLEFFGEQLIAEYQELVAGESNGQDIEVIAAITANFSQTIPDSYIEQLLVPLFSLVDQLEAETQLAIRQWAIARMKDSFSERNNKIDRQWVAAVDLSQALRDANNIRPAGGELGYARTQLFANVSNEKYNMNFRFSNAVLWILSNENWLDPKAMSCVDLMAEVIREHRFCEAPWFLRVVMKVSGISNTQELNHVGLTLAVALQDTYKGNRLYRLDPKLVAGTIILLGRMERTQSVDRIVTECQAIGHLILVQAVLLELENFELVLEQLPETFASLKVGLWHHLLSPSKVDPRLKHRFDASFEAHLRELLPRIDEPGLRLLTELYFSIIPDSEEIAADPTRNLVARWESIERRLSETTFANPQHRKLAHAMLMLEPPDEER